MRVPHPSALFALGWELRTPQPRDLVAAHYHIPLGTLRDWEQGRAEPDQPTQAYLKVIAREPERVERLLNRMPH
jgi:hypothetical protein